jgi:hypothetical protein
VYDDSVRCLANAGRQRRLLPSVPRPLPHLPLSDWFVQNVGAGPLKLDYKTLAALPTTSLQKVNRVSLTMF